MFKIKNKRFEEIHFNMVNSLIENEGHLPFVNSFLFSNGLVVHRVSYNEINGCEFLKLDHVNNNQQIIMNCKVLISNSKNPSLSMERKYGFPIDCTQTITTRTK